MKRTWVSHKQALAMVREYFNVADNDEAGIILTAALRVGWSEIADYDRPDEDRLRRMLGSCQALFNHVAKD